LIASFSSRCPQDLRASKIFDLAFLASRGLAPGPVTG